MVEHPEPAQEHALYARFSGLLARSAHLLGGSLQLWSPAPALLLALPDPPPEAALALLRDTAARVALQHAPVRVITPQEDCSAVPIRTRRGLSAILSFRRTASGSGTRSAGPAAVEEELVLGYVGDLARLLAQYLDLLSENAAQTEEILVHRGRQQVLGEVRRRLALPAAGRETLAFILEQARAASSARVAVLALGDHPLLAAEDPRPSPAGWMRPQLAQELADGIALRLRATRERIVRGELATILPRSLPVPGPAHLLALGLRRGDRHEGFLAMLRIGERPFDHRDLQLHEALGEQILVALRGGEAEILREAYLLSTVRALVAAIEAKDPHTSGHSTRVHLLSMLLGKEMGLSPSDLESLQWASILHDVGKIGMPEAILLKAAPLTREEFEIVKTHPLRGYQVLQHILPLQDAAQAVLLHHERYGGGGYPLGLAAEGIPLAARIIAVADTFDALTSFRPYRRPCSEDEAFAEIARARGAQFDPQVVAALEKMLPFLRENLGMIATTIQAA